MNKFQRQDIFRLVEHFNIGEPKKLWDLLRKGSPIIFGKKFAFIKVEGHFGGGIESINDDLNFSIINIINIKTGKGDEYKYAFYEICGDYYSKFYTGITNAMSWYKFTTGEEVTSEKITEVFSKLG